MLQILRNPLSSLLADLCKFISSIVLPDHYIRVIFCTTQLFLCPSRRLEAPRDYFCSNSSHSSSSSSIVFFSFHEISGLLGISRNSDIWTFMLSDFWTLGLLDFRISGLPKFRTSGLPDFFTFGLLDIRTSELPDFRTCRLPDFRISVFQTLGH